MIKQVEFLGIHVANQDRALKFYTEKLGFKLERDQPMGGSQRWISLKLPGAETGVVLYTPEGQEDRIGTFVNTSFKVDDVHKTYEELKAKGVQFADTPKKESWGSYVTMKDSEGNQIVLRSE